MDFAQFLAHVLAEWKLGWFHCPARTLPVAYLEIGGHGDPALAKWVGDCFDSSRLTGRKQGTEI